MSLKKFSQYLIDEKNIAYFTYGNMNPPTSKHEGLFEALTSYAGKFDYKIYSSQIVDESRNPLSYSDKIKHMRKMFPKYARNIIADKKIYGVTDIARSLYEQGYQSIVMITGKGREAEYATVLEKWNGKKGPHGYYVFENIDVLTTTTEHPDKATKTLTESAENNDFVKFSQSVPSTMSNNDARKFFNDVRKGMGLNEEHTFKNHVDLGKLSETREKYVAGELYELGDDVIIKETQEVGKVCVLGANYVLLELNDGKKVRKWLDDVELLEKTLTKAELKKREEIAKAIEREKPGIAMNKKMAIATAQAKKVAEVTDPVTTARDRISKEKEQDRKKHDQLLDRARKARARANAQKARDRVRVKNASSSEYRG